MNGEHKTGGGDTATQDEPSSKKEDQDAEARARQDVTQHPRMLAMAAIAAKHEADIDDQLAAEGLSSRVTAGEQTVNDDRTTGAVEDTTQVQQRTQQQDDGARPQTKPAPAAKKGPAQVDLQAFGTDPVPMEALDNLRVKVKIDGVEKTMTMQELRRSAQIDGAAMARLEQANELLRTAREAATTAKPQPPVGVEGNGGSGDSSATSEDVTAAAEGLVDALFVGDKTAAVETVKKLLQGAQPARQQVDTGAITTAVRQQLSQEEAEAQFRSDFKDVVSDPSLVIVADRFFAEAQAADPQKSYGELLAEAGNSTRAWLGRHSPNPATGQSKRTSRQEKLEAKGALDEPASLSRTEVKDEPVIESHSDVIAKMRAQRGLA